WDSGQRVRHLRQLEPLHDPREGGRRLPRRDPELPETPRRSRTSVNDNVDAVRVTGGGMEALTGRDLAIDPTRIHHRWQKDLEPALEIRSGDTVDFDLLVAGDPNIQEG